MSKIGDKRLPAKNYFIDRHQGGERALLVHIEFPNTDPQRLPEFQELAQSAGADCVGLVKGRGVEIRPKYFVGKGKAEEIAAQVGLLKADVVIFNHHLTPAQERNLERLVQCRVLDRSGLILDIFSQRARTFEGKLQVELAQLQHLSTRLVRGWTHLERQKGGIGLRGPGETQLETDRRLLGMRIKSINKRLAKVMSQRDQGRRARIRANIATVSLVGYTNAGKSTLFNQLTHADVYVQDQLFATLDPTLRQIRLPLIGKLNIVDTVGFIRDLPHELVAAFRATLEETRQADLLLHIVDATREDRASVMDEVNRVLHEIGAQDVPQLKVYNKIDLMPDVTPRVDYDDQGLPWRVWVSAEKADGFVELRQCIVKCLAQAVVHCEIHLLPTEGALRAKLYELQVVEQESLDEQGHWLLRLVILRRDYERLLLAEKESGPA